MPKHEEKSSKTLNEAKNLVIELENELKHARASWSVFTTGNGLHRQSLRELINLSDERHTFDHIIRSSATMTVLSLCRLTDFDKPNRLTLSKLKSLINPAQYIEIYAENASSWHSEHLEYRKIERKAVIEHIPILHSQVSKFLKSTQLNNMRKLRDEALAHRLDLQSLRPTYDDIELVFKDAHNIVSLSSRLINGKSWDPKDYIEIEELKANDFWDRFEDGMKLKYASENPKSPQ
ncbi:AbiU2 domain-containing protein [Hirschia baltica]|uniref:HEPN AbiU2-like domain-containing protein n=1 Tax=Hirschia baltica (strain ATCC 49814 / DSM 5838 / IFAM 1418) TaxID=582402 RepID=C6XMQ3_HIRBI|nr:hypothetical protein [Hirschia baltica]ACT59967.1 hypothetical protein Hbal_2287 [Hirschia baltica ATCC 49814]